MEDIAALPGQVLNAFEKVPDLYLILSPEFTILTASDAYLEATLTQKEKITGKNIFEVFPDNPAAPQAAEHLKASLEQVLSSRKPHRMALQRYDIPRPGLLAPGFEECYWATLHTPVLDEQGHVHYIIQKVQPVTGLVKQGYQLGQLEEQVELRSRQAIASARQRTLEVLAGRQLLQSVIDTSPNSIAVFQILYTPQGEVDDLEVLMFNASTLAMTGLTPAQVIGKRYAQLFPQVIPSGVLDRFKQVSSTGQMADFEQWYEGEGMRHWFRFMVNKLDHLLVVTTADITEQKKAQQELQANQELLKATVDSSMDMIQVFRAVRNQSQQIIDFEWILNNPRSEAVYGDVIGRRLLELNPGVLNAGIFDSFKQVIETGKPQQYEQHYVHEQFDGWFHQSVVKLGDGVATTTADITARKTAEQEQLKHHQVLKQAEEVARMGSWEYDLSTATFHWSAGMYRLFGLPADSPVGLHTFLDHALQEDRPLAGQIVACLQLGRDPLEQILRLEVDNQVLTLQVKGLPVRDAQGQPTRMLGVALDLSDVKRLEQENLELRLSQQKALLLAILEAQEEERRRIAEALHNGVGQVLYATKLHLERATRPGLQAGWQTEALQTTKELLSEAIQETRRVSHDLVPVLLKDFGLKQAIENLCSKYGDGCLQLSCQAEKLDQALESYLEVALYRISQELINNIVKHAGATRATLQLRRQAGHILLQVLDNGKGFRPEESKNKGMGLRSIEDRVRLLNGSFAISRPASGKGTLVSILIPAGG